MNILPAATAHDRDLRVYLFTFRFQRDHGYTPKLRTIMTGVGLSEWEVKDALHRLACHGYIRRGWRWGRRAIVLVGVTTV